MSDLMHIRGLKSPRLGTRQTVFSFPELREGGWSPGEAAALLGLSPAAWERFQHFRHQHRDELIAELSRINFRTPAEDLDDLEVERDPLHAELVRLTLGWQGERQRPREPAPESVPLDELIRPLGSAPSLWRSRINVYDVADHLRGGDHHTFMSVMWRMPRRELLAAHKYILDHEAEVLDVLRRHDERVARENPPEVVAARIEATRRAWAERRAELAARKAAEEAAHAGDRR